MRVSLSAPTRHQRPRGTINRHAIVTAALAVVDRVGASALTIRAVAREVGAPPMSLYSYFGNKDELLDLMYAEVVRHLYRDSGQQTWQDEIHQLCRGIYTTLLQHPNWTPLLARRAAPMDVPVRERLLAMMVADGMQAELAFGVLSSCALATTGLVIAQLTLRDPSGQSSLDRRYEALTEWSRTQAKDSPVTREALSRERPFDVADMFARTLAALVRGFEVLAREARDHDVVSKG